tara:strand:- start:2491 stop:2811 length:321 start_codon:yes stop_codon:yes gene_type:complete
MKKLKQQVIIFILIKYRTKCKVIFLTFEVLLYYMTEFDALRELLNARFSGAPKASYLGLKMIFNVFGIIAFGIVMWYVNQRISRKRNNRGVKSSYFGSRYSKEWKK